MRKWEYYVEEARGRLIDDVLLNNRGEDGWELIQVMHFPHDEFHWLYVFKRPMA
jgi:hypothetical protein